MRFEERTKLYVGTWSSGLETVMVNSDPLPNIRSLLLGKLSWGHEGIFSHHLATSLLFDYFGGQLWRSKFEYLTDITPPWFFYFSEFFQEFVLRWRTGSNWQLSDEEITAWLSTKPEYPWEEWEEYSRKRLSERLRQARSVLSALDPQALEDLLEELLSSMEDRNYVGMTAQRNIKALEIAVLRKVEAVFK